MTTPLTPLPNEAPLIMESGYMSKPWVEWFAENRDALNSLVTDLMADLLHRHSELSGSDGTPNPSLQVDASGNVLIGTGTIARRLQISGDTAEAIFRLEKTNATTQTWDFGFVAGNQNLILEPQTRDAFIFLRNLANAIFTTVQTSTGTITHSSDLIFDGSSGEGLCYGSLYMHEVTQNIDISSVGQGVYVKVTGFSTGKTNNVTINSDAFNVDKAGHYKVDWQMSGDSQGNNKDYEVDLFLNGVEQVDGSSRREFGAAGSLGSMSGSAIIDITDTSHDLDIRVKEVGSGAGTDFDIFNMNFNIMQVGGT